MNAAEKLAGGIDVFSELVGRISSWLVMLLALVMGTNVLLRYGFSLGWIWAQELEWHLMVPICLIGMSYALRHGEHVRVDILFASYSPRGKHAVDTLAAVLSMAFSALVIWLSLGYVAMSWAVGEGTANPGGIEHRYIVKSLIPIGFALLFLQSLAQAIQSFLAFRRT